MASKDAGEVERRSGRASHHLMATFSADPIPQHLPAPPLLTARAALFLDFDGTLAPLALRPDRVQVHAGMPALLEDLQSRLDGAVGIVTGRRLQEVDGHLAPFVFGGAGLHGAELRRRAGTEPQLQWNPATRGLVAALRQRFARDPRILVEDKEACVALHFREAPERAAECHDVLHALAPKAEFEIVAGSMVVEARPRGSNKGRAVHALAAQAPFAGREPVFVGDDVTDEEGFAAAAELGGYGVKVGNGLTLAHYRFEQAADVPRWLQASLDAGLRGN